MRRGGSGTAATCVNPSDLRCILGTIAILLILGSGAFFYIQDAQAGEIFLEPAASPGPDPFSATPFAGAPDPDLAQPATAPSAPTVAPAGTRVVANSGSTPGLYGGSRNRSSCEPGQMVSFLQANPDKAQAWVDALNADPAVRLPDGQPLTVATIPQYVASLTSLVLLSDTRVTNHGFKGGRANQKQSVLQKGTAVLVDTYGIPRVKCYCGNPLIPATPTPGTPTYSGPRWPDFDPNVVTIVSPPPMPVTSFVVRDPDTGDTLDLPPGNLSWVPPGGDGGQTPPPDTLDGTPPAGGLVSPNPPDQVGRQPFDAPDPRDGGDDEQGDAGGEMDQFNREAENYANQAVDLHRQYVERGCGLIDGVHDDYQNHIDWALNQNTETLREAIREYQQGLRDCRPGGASR